MTDAKKAGNPRTALTPHTPSLTRVR
jgi:hypothetical protein